jgi:hypothetical protein
VITTGLADLGSGSNALSDAMSASGHLFSDWEWNGGTLAALTGTGSGISLYFVQALDDVNWSDGSGTVDPLNAFQGFFQFQPLAACTVNRTTIRGLTPPATSFKALVSNDTGAALKTVNELRVRFYSFSAS